MSVRKILIIGASSAIAQATARCFANAGDALFLVARDADRLQAVADDLRVRGAHQVITATLDVTLYDCHAPLIADVYRRFGTLDVALIAHGILPDQQACERSFALVQQAFAINTLSILSVLTHLAAHFATQKHGTLCVLSSVAGDRGRQSNYVYGSSKAAVDTFLQGLRNRLYSTGVRVLTIKPGFVDTPMTAAFPKGRLWTSPEVIAKGIYRALTTHKEVVYLPWFWYPIMTAIRLIPERFFKRLRL